MAKTKTKWLENTSVTAAKLGSDVAGSGIGGGNGSAITLNITGLSAKTAPAMADEIAIYDTVGVANKKSTRAQLLNKYDYRQPVLAYRPAINKDVDTKFPDLVDNVPTMQLVGNAATQTSGVAYVFVSDGRTPTKVELRYKVDPGVTVDLIIFDTSNIEDASTLGGSSITMTEFGTDALAISSGIGGTYAAGKTFRVVALAYLDDTENAYIGDALITY